MFAVLVLSSLSHPTNASHDSFTYQFVPLCSIRESRELELAELVSTGQAIPHAKISDYAQVSNPCATLL